MCRTIAVLALFLFLCSCDSHPARPNTSGISEVQFDDIPESLLESRDPAVEAAEAEGAFLEATGFGLVAVNIESPESLAELGLKGATVEDQPFLAPVIKTVTSGLAQASYVFLFEPESTQATLPQLLNLEHLPLVSITRIDRTVPTCTTMVLPLLVFR